jgi:hypothetical protein
MPANVDALVREGIGLLKSGKRMEAKQALMKAVEINQQSEQAWLWLSAVVDTPEERLLCLENVLDLNPNNVNAQKGIEETKREIAAKGGTPKSTPPDSFGGFAGMDDQFGAPNPFSGTGFDANPYGGSSSASDPALSGWSGFDTPSSSVEWGTPAPPSAPVQNEPTPADYDNWMAGLSLGASGTSVPTSDSGFDSGFDTGFGASDPFGSPAPADNSGFGNFDFDNSSAFGGNRSSGGNDPFGGSGFDFGNADFGSSTTTTPAFSPDSFDDSFDAYAAPAAPAQSASAFGDFSFDAPIPADSFGASTDDPFNLGKPAGGQSAFDFGTDDFFNGVQADAALSAPATMPVTQDDFSADSDFPTPSFGDEPARVGGFDAPEPPLPSSKSVKPTPVKPDIRSVDPTGASIFTTIDSTPSLANPSIYFQQIPEEIQASGTKRAAKPKAVAPTVSASSLDTRLVVMVVVLLVLNVGSLLILLSNLGS